MNHTYARRAKPIAVLALAAGLALAGCSADDGEAGASPAPSATMGDAGDSGMPAGASAAVGDLELTDVWVKESSLDLSAGFGTITNNGGTDDALVGASAPGVPEIQLHETVDGVMQQVVSFPIPAGGSLMLAPGGNHLMFLDLAEPLQVGETIEVTLEFESGGSATVEAPIKPLSMDDHMGDM